MSSTTLVVGTYSVDATGVVYRRYSLADLPPAGLFVIYIL